MAYEIGNESKINVKRKNREFLLEIKSGKFEDDDLLKLLEQRKTEMEEAFEKSILPEFPDRNYINQLTFQLRQKFYN